MSQKKLTQRNSTKQKAHSNKNLLQIGRDFILNINGGVIVVLVTLTVLFGIVILPQVSSYYIDSYQCNEKLANPKKEPKQAERVWNSCEEVLKKEPNNTNILKRAGRASLVRWNPRWESDQKDRVVYTTETNFRNAYIQNTVDAQAAFYKDFILDFKDVLSENPNCDLTQKRYSRALELYSEDNKTLEEEDYQIVFELSHFLINRDKKYETAIILLEKIPNTDPEFYKDVLLTKAIAKLSQHNLSDAKELFRNALNIDKAISKKESYKIKYHLASIYANRAIMKDSTERNNHLTEAIKLYDQITSDKIASNFYYAWRNKSFVLYLNGDYKNAVSAFERALDFKAAQLKELDLKNREFLITYRDKAKKYSENNQFTNEDDSIQLEEYLQKKRIFDSSFITHESNKDPFFNVEHDKFYQCRS
ncbi:tetratricopeptide repeat protein [Nostoc sp. DedSLP04]|uniref:tetratricopeptide repeat protein n=1 Tax=Nostoc sp. DedSLP04 TaxID=3075401 RepID=UPI002AD33937|nr:tetratricopeptide repeat protein [Nostoc sp. DedSLP04]MDZ8034198.1 tetratricopeptide repeat protein [Nostoc sp. DedSLP04]